MEWISRKPSTQYLITDVTEVMQLYGINGTLLDWENTS